ncbi:MAG: hypothetical protein AAF871_11140 [Pseudomonadota bacterium]
MELARETEATEMAVADTSPDRPLRIAICGEVSSGKSAVIHALLREVCLPDFFGIEDRPVIRISTGADAPSVTVLKSDGEAVALGSADELVAEEGLSEIQIMRTAAGPFGPCEIIEMPPLRDGHLTEEEIARIEDCDIMVWSTIGSQAWRLSEKSILDEIGVRRPKRGVLVVSRGDKFRSDNDRDRLMERVSREAASYFKNCVMMGAATDLIRASAEDDGAWAKSGAEALAEAINHVKDEEFDDEAHSGADIVDISPAAREAEEAIEPFELDEDVVVVPADAKPLEAAEPELEPAPTETEDDAADNGDVKEVDASPMFASGKGKAAKQKQLEAFISTLHGVIAVGSVELGRPRTMKVIAGDRPVARNFSKFCLTSAEAMLKKTASDLDFEGEHVSMKSHQVLYAIEGKRVLFFASETAKLPTGIARTAFNRLTALYRAIT